MKKLSKLTAILSLTISAFLTSCYQPVFYNISQDVESEDATVSGTIASIVRYQTGGKDWLVVNADGGVRYKDPNDRRHDAWHTYGGLPFQLHHYDYYGDGHVGEQIIKIVADTNTLYLVTCSYFDDNEEGTVSPDVVKIWAAELSSWADGASAWKLIASTKHDDASGLLKTYKYKYYYYSAFNVFCTNSYNPAHRKAFIRSGNTKAYLDAYKTPAYYDLNGSVATIDASTTVSTVITGNTFDTGVDVTSTNVDSVAWFNNNVNPFATVAVTTNEDKNNATPTFVYWGNGSTVCYAANAESWGTKHSQTNARNHVSSLAVCSDALIIGRGYYGQDSSSSSGGIAKTSLSSGIPGTVLVDFSTNAESQISSGYIVYALLNTEPDEAETASAIYASIGFSGTGSSSSVSYSSVGLWSYYPGRGNWNRE